MDQQHHSVLSESQKGNHASGVAAAHSSVLVKNPETAEPSRTIKIGVPVPRYQWPTQSSRRRSVHANNVDFIERRRKLLSNNFPIPLN